MTFDPKAFPGSLSPTQVLVGFDRGPPKTCQTETCSDSMKAARCLTGSRITVDALDDLGQRGGVILVNGTCERYLLRIYGSDNVLRGLELRGIEVDPNNPSTAVVDTLAIVGPDAQRNRIEQCIVRGGPGGAPGRGDALSVGDDAGTPGGADHDAVIVDSEITGAQDKGMKVVGGGHATVQTSCIHDNMNGGIQATEGGNVTAIRNVVQLNRLGPSQNGLLVGVPDEIGDAEHDDHRRQRGALLRGARHLGGERGHGDVHERLRRRERTGRDQGRDHDPRSDARGDAARSRPRRATTSGSSARASPPVRNRAPGTATA